ncbi:MAG: hypothetical protein U5L45_04560 [Saprospiraceae bacterium]|nr:hypothetical protein [Saprospiraceae bacterium]
MVRFSAKPKNEPHSLPSRERSEREMQKTLLGYAHSSLIINLKPYIKSKLLFLALASLAQEGECGSFFGQSPKNEPPLLLLRERSERKSAFKSVF